MDSIQETTVYTGWAWHKMTQGRDQIPTTAAESLEGIAWKQIQRHIVAHLQQLNSTWKHEDIVDDVLTQMCRLAQFYKIFPWPFSANWPKSFVRSQDTRQKLEAHPNRRRADLRWGGKEHHGEYKVKPSEIACLRDNGGWIRHHDSTWFLVRACFGGGEGVDSITVSLW